MQEELCLADTELVQVCREGDPPTPPGKISISVRRSVLLQLRAGCSTKMQEGAKDPSKQPTAGEAQLPHGMAQLAIFLVWFKILHDLPPQINLKKKTNLSKK